MICDKVAEQQDPKTAVFVADRFGTLTLPGDAAGIAERAIASPALKVKQSLTRLVGNAIPGSLRTIVRASGDYIMTIRLLASLATACIAIVAASPTYAVLLPGSQLTASIDINPDNNVFNVTQPFTSPQALGPGVEFVASLHETGFEQDFGISADFSTSALTFSFTSPAPYSNISTSPAYPFFTVNFGSAGLFDNIVNVVHTCAVGVSLCSPANTYLPTTTGTASSIALSFNEVRAGDIFTVNFAPGGAVPEPASWALMLVGFGAMGAAMRTRRKIAVSFG